MHPKSQHKIMRNAIVGGIVVLSLALFVAWIAILLNDRKPYFWPGLGVPSLRAIYPHRVSIKAFELQQGDYSGQLMVSSITIGYDMAPNGRDYLPISNECDLSLVINGSFYKTSSLTTTVLNSLGAEVDTATQLDENQELYRIDDGNMSISIHTQDGKPVSAVIGEHVESSMRLSTKVESLTFSWKSKEERVLPMSYYDCREYFGKPLSVKKWRAM